MKFQDLLNNLVTEGAMSKATYDKVYDRWKQENPNITKEDIIKIYNDFDSKKNGWSVENPTPTVYSFITRFDGKHGFEKFEATTKNLRNIESFSYKQIMSILKDYPKHQYDDVQAQTLPTIFDDKDIKATPQKIDASKGLWSDTENAYINEGTTRVYKITSQKQAQNFGYFVEKTNREYTGDTRNSPWCVTWRQGSMYSNYRSNGRTFYFVIDDTRDPKKDKYYLGALQYDKSLYKGENYRITTLENKMNEDTAKSWDDVVKIYPLLKNYQNKIIDKPLDPKSEFEANLTFVQQMSETPGPYEFARAPRREKKNYIELGHILRREHSWRSMDSELRKMYIDGTDKDNYLEKFSTFNFLDEVKKNGPEFKSLDRQLRKFLTGGIGTLVQELLSNTYRLIRVSIDKPNYHIYQSRNNGLCGIYDTLSLDWVKYDGIVYNTEFTWMEFENEYYYDEQENTYYVEKFTDKSRDLNFYCVYESETQTADAHFISQSKFDEIGLYNKETYEGRKVEPETDVDIKEYYENNFK